MPSSAIAAGVVDHEVAANEVGGLLKELTKQRLEEREMKPDIRMELENRIAMAPRFSTQVDAAALGPPSGYSCPDCSGTLLAVSDSNYRCYIGHAWTAEALLAVRSEQVESAMGMALRSLPEKAQLSHRLAEQVGPGAMRQRYQAVVGEAEEALSVLGDQIAAAARKQEAAGG